MKIIDFTTENHFRKLKVSPIHFSDLTLLVGVSGVGKTQIIKSILNLKRIAGGKTVNGLEWAIKFQTVKGDTYRWKGAYEVKKGFEEEFSVDEEDEEESKKNQPAIISEELYLNDKNIVQRDKKEIIFSGSPTVKLAPQESIVSLLKQEHLIAPVYNDFRKIIDSDQSNSLSGPYRLSFFINTESLTKKHKTLESIQELNEDIRIKLYLFYKNQLEIFNIIKARYIEVFPLVEDIKFAPLSKSLRDVPSFFKEQPFIHIKEKGISEWIHQGRVSSGMFRTLLHIAELYLSAKGTVILIDEFENSLGVNCIDELTSDLVHGKERNIQFILTSHHPYIINNIDPKNWKVVTRNAGVIKTFNADELKIGKSKHDAFIQLINLPHFTLGNI
jgi:predicted ATPase